MFKTEFQKKVRHRFFVTPVAGHNFSGVLIKRGNLDSVFADVKLHLPNTNPEPCSGELYIENSNIAYAQLMPPDQAPVINNVTHLYQVNDADD